MEQKTVKGANIAEAKNTTVKNTVVNRIEGLHKQKIEVGKILKAELFSLNQVCKLIRETRDAKDKTDKTILNFFKTVKIKQTDVTPVFIIPNWTRVKNNTLLDGKLARQSNIKGTLTVKLRSQFTINDILTVLTATAQNIDYSEKTPE